MHIHYLVARDSLAARSQGESGPSAAVMDALIALLSLVFVGLVLVAVLVLLRRMHKRRRMMDEGLPQYRDVKRAGAGSANHRGLTIHTNNAGRHSVLFFKDGEPMLANPRSPPHSPDNVPEIHITFPDEQDEYGRRKSGRVVVVRVGDATVGMEPLAQHHDDDDGDDEPLPAYEKESKGQFYSIDMDRIGGLKEKDSKEFY